jgi:hypothetical protein
MITLSAAARAETFFAYLNGEQQVPAAATSATGFGRVFVNTNTMTYTFSVVFSGLGSAQTLSHIHAPAAIGANAPVIINFGTVGGTSGTISGSGSITAGQLAQLRAHQGYINVHSVNFPNGEIRGQLGVNRPVDMDGDGRTDQSVLRFPNVAPPAVAQITTFTLGSTEGFMSPPVFGDANRDFPAPGDYDGDGRGDVALYRDGATVGAQSHMYYIQSSDSTVQAIPFGIDGDQVINRDYDGDGKTDLAVFRRGSAPGMPALWFYRGSDPVSNPTNGIFTIHWGTTGAVNGSTGDTPVPGDYDGDGKFDIAIYRFGVAVPNTNTYFIRRSSDFGMTVQPWGNFQTDYILPGDYDGDGKTDYCAARTGALSSTPIQWFILQSSNGQMAPVQTFGISSDLPVQGDYDGDARTDHAVYRRGTTPTSQSIFHVLRSFTNTYQGTPWGLQLDFPVATFDAR